MNQSGLISYIAFYKNRDENSALKISMSFECSGSDEGRYHCLYLERGYQTLNLQL